MSHINVAQDVQHEQYDSTEPSTVKIRLRRGAWEVEITCKEDRVRQVVESVLAGMSNSRIDEGSINDIASKSSTSIDTGKRTLVKSGATCKGLIEQLWHEGWFVNEHNLAEVHEELARRGYNYDRTAVSHALTDLVREGILSRVGSARVYRYVQRRPPLNE
jgi:hypothetical protein